MPRYAIRPGTAADAALCEAIEVAAAERFRGLDMAELVTITANDPYMRSRGDGHVEKGTLFVAAVGAYPVGYAALAEVDGMAHLCEIDVHPDHGGKGLGRRLMKAAERWARDQGHQAITLSTFIDVPWNGPWYARQGYVPFEQIEWGAGHLDLWQGQLDSALDCSRRYMMVKRLRRRRLISGRSEA